MAINFDNQSFTVYYENSFYTYNFKNYLSDGGNYHYNLVIGGGSVDDSRDNISINAGDKPFYYNVPSKSFWSSLFSFSCKQEYNNNMRLIHLFALFIYKK